jgi:signal transduction histidine kinase
MWAVNPRYDERGALSSVTAIGRDLTDRKRLERAEREAIETRAELRAQRVESEMRGEVLRRSIAAQEDERRRIARELHDETAQALTAVLLGLGQLESATELESARSSAARLGEQVSETLRELRRIAMSLRPTVLDDFGLVAAVEQLAKQRPGTEAARISFDHAPLDRRLDSAAETAVYRIVQEALTNAVKHSGASEIRVDIRPEGDVLEAKVVDDGSGFDIEGPRSEGLGLAGMRERAELVGGSLAIASQPGEGTTVVLRFPWRAPI